MRRLALLAVLLAAAAGLGAFATWRALARGPKLPDPPAVATQIREAARLETLDVTLYKKVSFEPEPTPAGDVWGDLANWARYTLKKPRGKAIVFAEAHLGVDLSHLGPGQVRTFGRKVALVLPPVKVAVELRPGDTEFIGSNLDSEETAKLFEVAKSGFEREVSADAALREKARRSAERSIRLLLLQLGFDDVQFVDALPAAAGNG